MKMNTIVNLLTLSTGITDDIAENDGTGITDNEEEEEVPEEFDDQIDWEILN